MRLFIAIPLAKATARELAAEVNRLQSSQRNPAAPDVRWSAPTSWHVTLQFLGKTSREQYDCVVGRLRELRRPRISIELGRIGTFPRAGILFVEIQLSRELAAMQQVIVAATALCGFVPEDRPYRPHITLARKGKSGDKNFRNLKLQTSTAPRFAGFQADSVLLYESISTPEGSRYEVRERFPLD